MSATIFATAMLTAPGWKPAGVQQPRANPERYYLP
jgi:hypothetical protein